MTETRADIVPELKPGMHVWFAADGVEGFREVATLHNWQPKPYTYNWDLARDWVTVTYTDGHTEDRPRFGSHEIWQSGPRPAVRSTP